MILYFLFISDPSFLYLMEIKDLRVLENRFRVLFMSDLQKKKNDA